MLVKIYQVRTEHTRLSKNNNPHTYFRIRKIVVLKCDNCGAEFERAVRDMDPRRINSESSHVCPKCNPKQFAQRKGVEGRRFWNTTVDLDIDIDKI
mgnify:CR=1 FL=1